MGHLQGMVGHTTLTDWFNFQRDLAVDYLAENPVRLGGRGHIVEIDETCVGGKRKYGRGRFYTGMKVWVFGAIDRTTGEAFVTIVQNR